MKPKIFSYIPDNEYFGMDLLIKKLLESKNDIAKYEMEEYWLDIGRMDDYKDAQEIYDKHFKKS